MDELVGHIILGRYRVDRFLDSGGMARVYEAWDSKRAARVALKLLNKDLAEDFVWLRRFAGEAETLERLKHPHIVRFLGFEEGHGVAFLVMEYIEGQTLRGYLKLLGRPLTTSEVLLLLRPVCSGLHYAHQLGVLHCDVKPANIFVERGGRVVLGDFGIARLSETATVTFSTSGTPAYMSPEQCRAGTSLDGRTDVYSLGITAYEMMTLDRPFKGDTSATSGSRWERVRWEQVNALPPPPRHVNSTIPPAVESVILRALAKEPGRRYAGALAFYTAFEQAAASEPAAHLPTVAEPFPPPVDEKRPVPAPEPAPRWRRLAGFMAAGLMALVILLLGLTGILNPSAILAPGATSTPPIPPSPTAMEATDPPPTEEVVVPIATTVAPVTATPAPPPVPSDVYILYVLNASNGMQDTMADVRTGLSRHLQGLDPTINAGLLAYGHRIDAFQDASCSAENVELLAAMHAGFAETLVQELDLVRTKGRSPLEEAIRAAYQEFLTYAGRTNAVIVLTDGGDNCGGDPLEPIARNEEVGQRLPIYVAGVGAGEDEGEQLASLAARTGGRYERVDGAVELGHLLDQFVNEIAR